VADLEVRRQHLAALVKGKGSEGDNLTGFDDARANPPLADLTRVLQFSCL
jgi:hypothetical protein